MRMRVVVVEAEIFVFELKDVVNLRIYPHCGQRTRVAGELQLNLLNMIVIYVQIAESVDKLAQLQMADLCNHHCQKRIGCDVERHAQKCVGAALVELTREAAVTHIELEQRMARRQSHVVDVGHVPSAHNQAARVWIGLDVVYQFADLVDVRTVGSRPRAPLVAIDVPQIAVGVSPLVPNTHAVVLQILDIGVAGQEPQQLMDYRFQVQFFCCQARKTVVQVEPHLIAESTYGASSGAVAFGVARLKNVRQHVKILLHCSNFCHQNNQSRAIGDNVRQNVMNIN